MTSELEDRKGLSLWSYIEIKAREKFGKDKAWELVEAELKEGGIASVTLRLKGSMETVKGTTVYRGVS
jgi:hypothetical protein